jgi:DNA-binding NtrC family response regulator
MLSRTLFIGNPENLTSVFGTDEWLATFGSETLRSVATAEDALPILTSLEADCVVITGFDAAQEVADTLERIQSIDASIPVIVACASVSATEAVRLGRAGAWNCFGTGDSPDRLWDSIECAREQRSRRRVRASNDSEERWRTGLVGNSSAMDIVADTIRLVAVRRTTVLISGETGTGKEMAARAIHMSSPRAHMNMIAVNCSALPKNLLEAELFGHTKGAFTGATNQRIGRFEQAHQSTIFLDEIGEMPLEVQAKLLRVIQERELQLLGSSETIKVDVRIIAATNVNLQERVQQGTFREDLYYRLNVVPLKMPALRDRPTDIPNLVQHFLKKICLAEGVEIKSVTPEALDRLCAHRWPGNVRQLENTIEMGIAMSGEREILSAVDFGFKGHEIVRRLGATPCFDPPNEEGFDTAVGRFQLRLLENALVAAQGNQTLAAERLGLKRTTLIMKMRTLQPDFRLDYAS